MRTTRGFRALGVGASLALVLSLSTPLIPGDGGASGVAFAQGGSGSGQQPTQPGTPTGTGSGTGTGTGGNTGTGSQTGTGTGSPATTTTQQAGGQSSSSSSGMMSDPMRGGMEVPGQPMCFMPAMSVTERKMYSLERPSCFPGHMQ